MSGPTLNPLYWLLLAFSDELKREEKIQVLKVAKETAGSLEEFVDKNFPGLPSELGRKVAATWDNAPKFSFLLQELSSQGVKVLALADPAYPSRLKTTLKSSAPFVVFLLGEAELLRSDRTLAIIGSRKASEEGLKIAERVGAYFGREGYVVVSGMAKGIDREAVVGALKAGGKAIGVLPFGLLSKKDIIPLLQMFQEDLTGGRLALISEFIPKVGWKAWAAMARNRTIVGLADFVLVVESGLKESQGPQGKKQKSGTWSAVEEAGKRGKKVFVIDLPKEGNQELVRAGLATPVRADEQGLRNLEDWIHEEFQKKLVETKKPQKKKGKAVQDPLFPKEKLN